MSRLPNWLTPLVAVLSAVGAPLCDVWRIRRGRRRVREAVERETARHVPALVPEQRKPETPPQGWWDFIPTQRRRRRDR